MLGLFKLVTLIIFLTLLTLEIENNKVEVKNVSKIINYIKLVDSFKSECWKDLYTVHDVDLAAEIFFGMVDKSINASTTKIKNSNSKSRLLKEWMTPGLLHSLLRKQELSSKVNKHATSDDQFSRFHNSQHVSQFRN